MKRTNDIRVADVLPKGWQHYIDERYPRLGLGFDVATTLKKPGGGKGKSRATVSNPSAICLDQQVGFQSITRLMLRFRTNDPAIATALLEAIINGIPHGLRVGKLCVDASNERFFAANLRKHFAGKVVVVPVINSENTEYRGLKMNHKQYLGSQLVDHFDDGYCPIPEADWLCADMRLVKKIGDTFDAEVDENGNHGDTFDAKKLALHALVSKGGPAEARASPVGTYGGGSHASRKVLNPFANRFEKRGGSRRAM
ncbi:hypothetical protein [Horticoccus sp. 23ND18S-11]|uniref:hypothetical protein n=1 Tax=Horticoccus sp. 23ND18S-11 TaxID=3391832 RepID=UPI0039C9D18F